MGDNRNNKGATKEPLYRRYIDIKSRCLNPNSCNYKYYGGRGISICEEWLGENGYKNFKEWSLKNGYSSELSIDRINNDGNYEPSNCRWTTRSVQNTTMRHKNTSGYIGICKHSDGKHWYGRVKVDKKCYYTGMSLDVNEAVIMRNEFIVSNNFPNVVNRTEAE